MCVRGDMYENTRQQTLGIFAWWFFATSMSFRFFHPEMINSGVHCVVPLGYSAARTCPNAE